MKLTLRISLLLAVVTATVLLVLEFAVLRHELELLEDGYTSEALVVAQAVAKVAAQLDQAQLADSALSDSLGATVGEHVEVHWRPVEELDLSEAALADLSEHPDQPRTLRSKDAIVAWAPIRGEARLVGVIEVRRSMTGAQAYVRRNLSAALGAILCITLLTGIIAQYAGRFLVGSRVDVLVEKTRQVARGDLEQPVHLPGSDELSMLGEALDQMSKDLARLRRVAAQEELARLEAERALLHSDRLRTLGVLAAGVAHEVGTPLNVITGRSSLIERRSEDELVRRDAATIREQVARISHIVRLMMAFARGAAPEVKPSDLGLLVRNAVDLLASELQKHKLRTELTLPEAPLVARVDPMQLSQLLTNLILNAIQASPAGGCVRVLLEPSGAEHVLLAVEDEGEGVPMEQREQVLEPFFTTKPPGEGTGLGLSIVRRIVLDHQGLLRIESAPGGGARMVVILPTEGPT
ncbi:MAG: HAMP domain-containing protein [Alphaproteobacteria bacterium]|nr:HAMP domain-containing protein [Alphaproteobacteria bacterium]MCB9797754.1 HAMP domain-containing protein [Alphaproteobacteria bacterium]